MQNIFGGLVIYILSIFGCGSNAYNNSPEPDVYIEETEVTTTTTASEFQDKYDESLAQWNKDKKTHHDSYKFTLGFESVEGRFGFASEFVVKEGVVVERNYTEFQYDNKGYRKTTETWTETKSNLGEHDEGFPPQTLTEIYEDCGNTYIRQSPENNYVYFDTEYDGILSICGYVPRNCADDCFEGARLDAFEWL